MAEGQGIDRGEDAVLLWKEGMDLPAASAAGEEARGCEPGSAAYWAERSGGRNLLNRQKGPPERTPAGLWHLRWFG